MFENCIYKVAKKSLTTNFDGNMTTSGSLDVMRESLTKVSNPSSPGHQ
jgi:hypothetical protein